MRISNILVQPVITEKGVALADLGKYVFQVRLDATKESISHE